MAQLDADRSGELDRREFVDALAARVTSEGGGARDETLRAVLELVARVLRARHEALLSGQQRAAADRLEAEMVSKMSEATHMVVAKPTKRTIKLCAAISIVPHLVTVDWLTQSDSAGTFVSPDQYEFKGVHESAPGAPSRPFVPSAPS